MRLFLIRILFAAARVATARGWLIGQALHNKGMLLLLPKRRQK